MNSLPSWRSDFQKFLKGRLKIQQWAELGAVNHLQELAAENRRNSEAEGNWARTHVWGANSTPTEQGQEQAETMGNTILGDVQYPAPVVVSGPAAQPQSIAPMIALALASMILPTGAAAGAIGYLLAKDRAPPPAITAAPTPFEYESMSIGLGRIEEFTQNQSD